MLSEHDLDRLKSLTIETENAEAVVTELRKKLLDTPLVKSRLDHSTSAKEIKDSSYLKVTSIKIVINFAISAFHSGQIISNFEGANFFVAFCIISIIIAVIYRFFIKPLDGDILQKVNNSMEDIDKYYELKQKVMTNKSIITKMISRLVMNYCKNQPIIDIYSMKTEGLEFIPNHYLHDVLQQEVDKGVFEKIEIADMKNKGQTKVLYKSKTLSSNITSSIIEID